MLTVAAVLFVHASPPSMPIEALAGAAVSHVRVTVIEVLFVL
jgi:hypothetical protein